MKILIIEDDTKTQDYVAAGLKEAGEAADVVWTQDGAEVSGSGWLVTIRPDYSEIG